MLARMRRCHRVSRSNEKRWLANLPSIAALKVDQCVKPNDFGPSKYAQLQHFSGASENGYGTVSYLRLVNSGKKTEVAFMLGKSRVAPIKQVTIPRLELTAAVRAVRVDRMHKKELEINLDSSVFWTDRMTVLRYIQNETKRFHTFDANRVSVIRDLTDIGQWKHIK